jgi:hypothetical protein
MAARQWIASAGMAPGATLGETFGMAANITGAVLEQLNKTQTWEVANERKTIDSIASFTKAPPTAQMTLKNCQNKSCNYTLEGMSGSWYSYEHFANNLVAGSMNIGPNDYTTDKTGTLGGYPEDQITSIGIARLDQHRFFTISRSPVYDRKSQLFVPINEGGKIYAFEHMYGEEMGGPSWVNGISTQTYP